MGSTSSKVGRTATGAARRQYPMRPSPSTRETQQTPQQAARQEELHPREAQQARQRQGLRGEAPSEAKSHAINIDGQDPQLANALRQIGPVQPNPTYSPSSSAFSVDPTAVPSASRTPSPRNTPALAIMDARKKIEDEVESDKVNMGRPGFQGRRHVDVTTIRKALMLRDEQNVPPNEVERILGLRRGAIAELGRVGVVEAA